MVKLSKHIVDEMDGRQIRLAYIEAALEFPDRMMPDATDPELSRSLKAIPEFAVACFGSCIDRTAPTSSW